jgi:Aerobic-type carbon monoxide dehydrogenase, middle subunit CoxM/CutM homologs
MFDFEALYEAHTIDEAVALRAAHPKAQVIAGGSDQLIKIRAGRLAGCELLSIYTVDELRGVTLDGDGTLRIGPLTSFSHVTRDPLINRLIPVLGEAVDQVGGPQIRNIGTIGGNVCNGVTSADSASTLLAWDAVMELTGPEGKRRVPDSAWYLKAGQVDIRPGEILTAILIPKTAYDGYFGSYFKYAMRNAMDIATTGCSVNVKLSADKKTVGDARVAFGVASPVPVRAPSAEAVARGAAVSEKTAEDFSRAVLADIHPRTSWRATAEFREHISVEMAKRTFLEAVKRAGGEF